MFHLFYELGSQTAEETTLFRNNSQRSLLQIVKWLLIDGLQIYRMIKGNLKG